MNFTHVKTGHFYFKWSKNGAFELSGAEKQATSLVLIEF
jgi:hypothetical protein